MKLTLAILSIPFRLIFAVLLFTGILIFGFLSALCLSIKNKRWHPWKKYWKVLCESFISACGFPFWPVQKLNNR